MTSTVSSPNQFDTDIHESGHEIFSLIWLDSNPLETRNTDQKLRAIINHLIKFQDVKSCQAWLEARSQTDRIVMIVSGTLGREIVPRVNKLRQVISIFVYCRDKERNKKWADQFSKVKAVVNEYNELITRIAADYKIQKILEEPLAINIYKTGTSTTDINGEFIFYQVLIDCLLRLKSTGQDNEELIRICRKRYENNSTELKNIDDFMINYSPNKALWWYTKESFFYKTLNACLRGRNIHMIFLFRRYISDIHRQLSNNSPKQLLKVYRSQLISSDELKRLIESRGQLISINSFFSTSLDRDKALSFLNLSSNTRNLESVLFEIDADSKYITSKPFADITAHSSHQEEVEVLFILGSIFRLNNVHRTKENRLSVIKMTLCSENEHDFKHVLVYMKQELGNGETNLHILGKILWKMGKLDLAEQYFMRLLKELHPNHAFHATLYKDLSEITSQSKKYTQSLEWTRKLLSFENSNPSATIREYSRKESYSNGNKKLSFSEKPVEMKSDNLPLNHENLAKFYENIGDTHYKKGEYSKALSLYQRVLEIRKQALSPNHPHLIHSYMVIGNMYYCMGEYSKALLFHEQALEMMTQAFPPNHPNFAQFYNSIGLVYDSMGEYSRASSFYEQALELMTQAFPPNHPNFAQSYNNIGLLCYNMGEYSRALSLYGQAIEIMTLALPPNHPDFAQSYINIGLVYNKIGEYSMALSFYEQALEVLTQAFPPNHPKFAQSYNNMGLLYYNMGEYSKALSFYEQGQEIMTRTLHPNHLGLATSYNNIGLVYNKLGEYSKALSFYEQSLEVMKQAFPLNHPHLGYSYSNIANVYLDMEDYANALPYFEKAIEIREKSLPTTHVDLATSYNGMGTVYAKKKMFSEASRLLEKALNIRKQALSGTHPDLATSYWSLGLMYNNMGQYATALSYHERALTIRKKVYPATNSVLGQSYKEIGSVYRNMNNYTEALSYYEQALRIWQHSLPVGHSYISSLKRDIEDVKRK